MEFARTLDESLAITDLVRTATATATRSTCKVRTARASTGPTASYRTARKPDESREQVPLVELMNQFSWLRSLFSRAVSLLKQS